MNEHVDGQLPFYIRGQLSTAEQQRIAAHLAACEPCRQQVETWQLIALAVEQRAAQQAASLPPLKLQKGRRKMTLILPRYDHRWLLAGCIVILAAVLLLLRVQPPEPPIQTSLLQPTPAQTLDELIREDESLQLFARMVAKSEWVQAVLAGEEAITVFAPTDAAMQAVLVDRNIDELDQQTIEAFLFSHLALGGYSTDYFDEIHTLRGYWQQGGYEYGSTFTITRENDGFLINGISTFVAADRLASNGVLHLVEPSPAGDDFFEPYGNSTLSPSIYFVLKSDERFSRFMEAVDSSAWAVEILQGTTALTVFAPTNEALAGRRWLDDEVFVFRHLVQGNWSLDMLATYGTIRAFWERDGYSYGNTLQIMDGQLNDRARLTSVNRIASNGIIHEIDAPLVEG